LIDPYIWSHGPLCPATVLFWFAKLFVHSFIRSLHSVPCRISCIIGDCKGGVGE